MLVIYRKISFLCFFCVVVLAGIARADGDKPVSATSDTLSGCYDSLSEDETNFLKPIDVLVVNGEYLMQAWPLVLVDGSELRSILQQTMNEITKGNEWITVEPLWTPTGGTASQQIERLKKPNTALVTFTISARKIQSEKQGDISLGAMTVHIESRSTKQTLPAFNVSIPFLISTDKGENLRNIKDAAVLLVGHLPGFMRCARKMEPYNCTKNQYKFEDGIKNDLQ